MKTQQGFGGAGVLAFESRRNAETARIIRRHGGQAVMVPSLREVPVADNRDIHAFGEELLAGEVDAVVFTTGGGAERLLRVLDAKFGRAKVRRALRRAFLLARGPKPASALEFAGLSPSAVAPEPDTWRETLRTLARRLPLRGKRVAVQEYGVPNLPFLKGLETRGAAAIRLPVYRWALPADVGPLRAAVRRVVSGEAGVLLFTNANQVNNVFQIAGEMGNADAFRRGLARHVVASIGPHCSERLRRSGARVDVQPAHPRLEDLVRAAARASGRLLGRKARVPAPKERASDPLADSLFLRACRREKTERPPIWLMRQAGRYMKNYRELRARVSMLELCKHPDLVADVTVDAVERLGVDAAILFSDLLLIVEPMGFRLEYSRGEGPVIRPPLRAAADVRRVKTVDVARSLGFVAEAVRRTRARLPANVPLLGFAGAPFTLASYLIEGGGSRNFIRTKSFMYGQTAAWHALMRKVSRALGDLLNLQVRAGAQAVQVFDSWVGCLSPEDYRRFVLPHSRAVIRAVKGAPVIHFGTQTTALLELMKEAGGDVIGFDWRVDLDAAWKRLGNVAVMGNLDPAALFGTPAEIRRKADDVLRRAAGRPGHIFNLGHGILPETPVENVRALVDHVKRAGRSGR